MCIQKPSNPLFLLLFLCNRGRFSVQFACVSTFGRQIVVVQKLYFESIFTFFFTQIDVSPSLNNIVFYRETSRTPTKSEEALSTQSPKTQTPDLRSWPKSASKISSPTAVIRAGNKELKQRLNLNKTASLHAWASSALDNRVNSPGDHDVVLANCQSVRCNNTSSRPTRGFSFKKMADAVHLRPKTGSQSGRQSLERTPSRRSQLLSRFFTSGRRQSRDDLIRKGIYRPENVFGNDLAMIAMDNHLGIPLFITRCVHRIESMVSVEGVYRVNGDAAAVQKIRLDVDQDDFRTLEETKDVSLLASSLKLFFRELPTPIISETLKHKLFEVKRSCEEEKECRVKYKKALESELDELTLRVLGFLMTHLSKVAEEPRNKMDAKNLAVVFSPNLVHNVTEARRPESIIGEMELSNVVVEDLIKQCHTLFDTSSFYGANSAN